MSSKILAKTVLSASNTLWQLEEVEKQVFAVIKYVNGEAKQPLHCSGNLKRVFIAFKKAIGKTAVEFDNATAIIEENTIVRHKHFRMGTGSVYDLVGIWSMPPRSMMEKNNELYYKIIGARPSCCQFHCDHCGTSIEHHYIIQDENKEKFVVGSSCIEKLNQTHLTTQAKAKKLEIDRQKRKEAAEERRAAREAKIQAEQEAQRERNGGLTDYELKQKQAKENAEALVDFSVLESREVVKILKATSGDFCNSMIHNLRNGKPPRGRAKEIVIEIIAKNLSGSRKGSKKYNESHVKATEMYESVETKINEEKQRLGVR